jgi:hypothetical protein
MVAAAFAAFAIIGRIVGGSKAFEGGVSFPNTLLAEFGSGLVGGAIFGLTFRSIHSVISAAIVGLVIGEVSGFAMLVADAGFAASKWELDNTVPFGALGLVVAVIVWRRYARLKAGGQIV